VEVQDLGVGVVQQAPKPIGGAVKARKVSIVHGRIVMAKDVRVLLGAVTQVPTMALTSRRWSGAAHIGACVDAVQLAPIEQGRTSIFQARADHLGRGMDPVKRQREGGVAASSQKLRAMARRPEAAAVRDRGKQHRGLFLLGWIWRAIQASPRSYDQMSPLGGLPRCSTFRMRA
jgi:hypothetical protein